MLTLPRGERHEDGTIYRVIASQVGACAWLARTLLSRE